MKSFASIDGFVAHLGTLGVAVGIAETVALERAAKMIELEAQQEIGRYQRTNTGEFAPWDELSEWTKADRAARGFPENNPGLVTGEMLHSIGHHVEHVPGHGEAVVGSDDQHLVWFELGTVKQPPRSVLGMAAFRQGKAAVDHIGGRIAYALSGLRGRND